MKAIITRIRPDAGMPPERTKRYVRAAIRQGFDELGFSDHVPWPYQNRFSHPGACAMSVCS